MGKDNTALWLIGGGLLAFMLMPQERREQMLPGGLGGGISANLPGFDLSGLLGGIKLPGIGDITMPKIEMPSADDVVSDDVVSDATEAIKEFFSGGSPSDEPAPRPESGSPPQNKQAPSEKPFHWWPESTKPGDTVFSFGKKYIVKDITPEGATFQKPGGSNWTGLINELGSLTRYIFTGQGHYSRRHDPLIPTPPTSVDRGDLLAYFRAGDITEAEYQRALRIINARNAYNEADVETKISTDEVNRGLPEAPSRSENWYISPEAASQLPEGTTTEQVRTAITNYNRDRPPLERM